MKSLYVLLFSIVGASLGLCQSYRGGTETPEQEAERRMAYDLQTLEIEKENTRAMGRLLEIEKQKKNRCS